MNQQPSSSSSTADPLSFTTLTSAASGTSGASGAGAGADAEDFSGASVVQETKYSVGDCDKHFGRALERQNDVPFTVLGIAERVPRCRWRWRWG